jgi:predicted  nucleic acid-binding Zn-ribbon protein
MEAANMIKSENSLKRLKSAFQELDDAANQLITSPPDFNKLGKALRKLSSEAQDSIRDLLQDLKNLEE